MALTKFLILFSNVRKQVQVSSTISCAEHFEQKFHQQKSPKHSVRQVTLLKQAIIILHRNNTPPSPVLISFLRFHKPIVIKRVKCS